MAPENGTAADQEQRTIVIERILDHPDLQNLRRVTLLTRDGAEFYSGLGFTKGASELTYMERRGAFRPESDTGANL